MSKTCLPPWRADLCQRASLVNLQFFSGHAIVHAPTLHTNMNNPTTPNNPTNPNNADPKAEKQNNAATAELDEQDTLTEESEEDTDADAA